MRASLAAAALVAALSCGNPTRYGAYAVFLNATGNAVANDTLSFCELTSNLPVLRGLPPWSGTTSVHVTRGVSASQGQIASRDTVLVVSYEVTQDTDRFVFVLGAPLNDTLSGAVMNEPQAGTSGPWSCPETLPFAANTMLVSRGYHAVPPPSGSWALMWLRPID